MGELTGENGRLLLLILNPAAGTRYAAKYLPEMIALFTRCGWQCLVSVTEKSGDAVRFARENAGRVQRIVCIGGDGTFNETVTGVMQSGADIPIGYIPAGSTNDFANSIGLSSNVMQAARDAMEGMETILDIGRFENRYFSYVASFGAFTKTSYATPQQFKNVLGHLAYLLEGILDLSSLKSNPVRIVADGTVYENGYLFGAVSNSTSIGGILTLPASEVDMRDGLFEMMLVHNPASAQDIQTLVAALTSKQYRCDMIDFIRAKKIEVYANADMDWSLDGEYEPGQECVHIENVHEAVRFIVPRPVNEE